ncbi:hypothetical protein CIK98_10775 [Prevotella sp. P2-180]|nr:hypothetical protein CIK98_10775 [Prevotella sp. P2-180]
MWLAIAGVFTVSTLSACSDDDNDNKAGSYVIQKNGVVEPSQQVDMGVFNIDGKNYRLIFAKTNLTARGLAKAESDFGDFFSWAAPEPWCTAYERTATSLSPTAWISGKTDGYTLGNAQYYDGTRYTKYQNENEQLSAEDDAAHNLLGGDWQIPSRAVWQALLDANNQSVTWGKDGEMKMTFIDETGKPGMKISSKSNPDNYIFLPATGRIIEKEFLYVGIQGNYLSSTLGTPYNIWGMGFGEGSAGVFTTCRRMTGCVIRPVRLVAE